MPRASGVLCVLSLPQRVLSHDFSMAESALNDPEKYAIRAAVQVGSRIAGLCGAGLLAAGCAMQLTQSSVAAGNCTCSSVSCIASAAYSRVYRRNVVHI
jgi:hypothetical protein